jgi:hypothetical protein
VSKNSNDAADAAGVGRSDESSDINENMPFSFAPLKLLVLMFAGWISRHQLDVIEYLQEENRVLKERSGGGC